MSHDHDHPHGPHCDHDHNHDHHHHDEGFVARVQRHIKRRFSDNILDTVDDHGHAVQTEFTTKNKVGAIAIASLGVGAAIHGGVNVMRGIQGYTDSLGEKHEASGLTTTVGLGEAAGGLLVTLRALTGRWRG